MGKELKTNAMRFLDTKKIAYEVQAYQCDEFIDGVHVAEKLGQPLDETFKTIVAQGKSGSYYCFLLPVAEELDLKKAAKAVGEKSMEMLKSKDLLPLTGYIHGGCSPIGMKKFFTTTVHYTAESLPTFCFSGGKIGWQVEMSLDDLKKLIHLQCADIIE